MLRDSRLEYKEFPLRVFTDHIKQELNTRKYYHMLKVKGKKKPHHWVDKNKLESGSSDSKGDDDGEEGAETVILNLYLS